jgi:hypothetical protein
MSIAISVIFDLFFMVVLSLANENLSMPESQIEMRLGAFECAAFE